MSASSVLTALLSNAPLRRFNISQTKTSISTELAEKSRPAIILIHGYRGAPIGLSEIAEDLRSAGYTVYVPPIPPFAGTKSLPSYTPTAYADYIADYIKTNRLKHPILIGHSMGSVIAAATSNFHPDLINQKLVLMAPLSSKPSKFFRIISPLSAYLPRRSVDYITTRYLFVADNKETFRRTMAITAACSSDRPPLRRDFLATTKFSASYSLNELDLGNDILFLVGEHDRLIKRQKTEQLAKKLNAKVKFLSNTGHLLNYERPHETSQAILDFLKPKPAADK